MIKKTLLYTEGYETISVNMPLDLDQYVRSVSNRNNKKTSQGVVIYEMVKMFHDANKDLIDDKESSIEDKLVLDYNIDKEKIDEDIEVDDHAGTDDMVLRKYNIPKELKKEIKDLNMSKLVRNSIRKHKKSRYNSRFDRITVKEDVLKHLKHGKKDIDDRARDIVETLTLDISTRSKFEENRHRFRNWEERAKAYEDLDDNEKHEYISDVVNYLVDVYDVSNRNRVERKVRPHLTTYEYRTKVENLDRSKKNIKDAINKEEVNAPTNIVDYNLTIDEYLFVELYENFDTEYKIILKDRLRDIYEALGKFSILDDSITLAEFKDKYLKDYSISRGRKTSFVPNFFDTKLEASSEYAV